MTSLRVLHWNVHSWLDDSGKLNDDRVADLITRTSPHVVSLVEVDEPHGACGPLDDVAASCGYASVFCPALEFGSGDSPRGAFGNAILTRAPILAVRHRHLLWPVPSYDGSEESEARTVTFADLATDLGPVTAGATHLPRGDEAARVAAIARLADIVTGFPRWFIAGDFNTPPGWAHERELTVAPTAAVPTYPAPDPREPIDYVVTAAPLRAVAEVLHEPGSDHFPVLATVTLHEKVGRALHQECAYQRGASSRCIPAQPQRVLHALVLQGTRDLPGAACRRPSARSRVTMQVPFDAVAARRTARGSTGSFG